MMLRAVVELAWARGGGPLEHRRCRAESGWGGRWSPRHGHDWPKHVGGRAVVDDDLPGAPSTTATQPITSRQPSDVTYGIELWRDQCEDFLRTQLPAGQPPPVVIGHSFGSCVALELARSLADRGAPARAVGMMNCGVGMNNKNALKVEAWRRKQEAAGVPVDAAAPAWQARFDLSSPLLSSPLSRFSRSGVTREDI